MGHRTGKKERIMIACVTFETVKVTEPVKFYECNKVHIIHYVKPDAPAKNVFEDFYEEVCRLLKDYREDIEIEEHNCSVSNFSVMLSEILSIIEKEQKRADGDCEIYVNISAGSSEYSAAAAIGAMMSENVTPFSVNTDKYTVGTEEEIKKAYYRDDKPVGLTSRTYSPKVMPKYTIDKPKEHLVRGLRRLQERNDTNQRAKSTDIIADLKEMGLWYRDKEGGAKQSEAVQYYRDYTSKWLAYGWIRKDEMRKRFVLTKEGETVIETFYVD